MTAIATLTTILPDIVTLSFDAVNFDGGHPQLDQVFQVNPLVSMGVNNMRLRLPRKDYPAFGMLLLRGVTDWAAAVTLARQIRGIKGYTCTFIHTAAGVDYVPETTFYVMEVTAMPLPGEFIGGEVDPAGASIQAAITLQATGVAP